MSQQLEITRLAQNWSTRTHQLLLQEIDKLDVRDTDALRAGLQARVLQERANTIIELKFKKYGRFVDMGAGIQSKKQTREALKNALLGTKSKNGKKWYSPIWFGRLHDLYGAIGFEVVEQIIKVKGQY